MATYVFSTHKNTQSNSIQYIVFQLHPINLLNIYTIKESKENCVFLCRDHKKVLALLS